MSEKWAKTAKNPKNGGQNGHLGNKGAKRGGQDPGAGLPIGQPAGHAGQPAGQAGGPAGPVVKGQISRFSGAVSAFLRRKKSESLREQFQGGRNLQTLPLKFPIKGSKINNKNPHLKNKV